MGQQLSFLQDAEGEIFSDEWYTPASLLDPARLVLGAIDLDPASCASAQRVVQAGSYYTKADDGLHKPWYGRTFVNPPYSTPLIGQFVDKLLAEFMAGNVTSALILTNNATDTTWAQKLLVYPHLVCFLKGRVRFWQPDKPGNTGARQGQMLTYLGQDGHLFCRHFATLGAVLRVAQ